MNANSENQLDDRQFENDKLGSDQWTNCAPGLLRQCAAATVRPASPALPLKVVGLSLAVACGLVAIVFTSSLWMPKEEVQRAELPYKGGLACAVVLDSMPDYFDAKLDDSVHQLTTKHLLDCPPCLAKFEREAASRGLEIDLTLAATNYSPAMQWPSERSLYSSLTVVAHTSPPSRLLAALRCN